MEFLCGLAFVIVIITVVGHGFWVLAAAILRSITGTLPQTPPSSLDQAASNQPPTPSGDLRQANALIERLTKGKILSVESYCAIRELLDLHAKDANTFLPPPLYRSQSQQAEAQPSPASPTATPTPASPTIPEPIILASAIEPSTTPVLPKPASELTHATVAPTTPTKVHALDRNYDAAPPKLSAVVEAQSRRAFGEVLQQFLSEKNIYWGELLSAVLIVGSAVGLILSLRSELSRIIPLFPAVLFLLITTAIHLAGFYTLKRWKLPSTSRGLLLIGSLLIPLTGLSNLLVN